MSTGTSERPRPIQMRAINMPEACRGVKLQQRADGQGVMAVGYAAVFYRAEDPGTEYKLWSDVIERVMPGAFDRAIREQQDVRGLFNHSVDRVLGRTKSKTMRLSVDATGLMYEIDLPANDDGDRLQVLLERQDVDGSSFSFFPQRAVWVEEGDILIRQLEDVDLFDVGPVVFPAYESTTAGVRSDREAMLAEARAALKNRGAAKTSKVDVDYRLAHMRNEESRRRIAGRD